MIRLRLLGQVELVGADGREIGDVMRQPKRLAVLAVLAAAPAGRVYRRDTLLSLFWPESNHDHARAALRRTLSYLRSRLPGELIRTRGDEVGVGADGIWCDVAACEAALAEGRWDAAVELYRGDLLEGFHVPGAAGFERWADETRDRLRRAVAAAAGRMADRAEQSGDLGGAVRWNARCLEIRFEDELRLRRLLIALSRSGDLAAAMRAYDEFARRLATELELAPGVETVNLINMLRAQHKTAVAGPPTAPQAGPPDPDLVAVFPFTIRGAPDLQSLGAGMVDLLTARLDGLGDLRAVDPQRALTAVMSVGTEALTPDLARPLAAELGAGAFVLGRIARAQGRLVLRASLHDTVGAREAPVTLELESDGNLVSAVDELAGRLVAGRSTSHGGVLTRLGALTMGSLPALRAYLAGEQALRLGCAFEARGHYLRAVELDPGFGLAQYRLGAAQAACGDPRAALEATERAVAAGERLAPHARALLTAQHEWISGAVAEAERRYVGILNERPDDVEAWYGLGALQLRTGGLRGRSAQDASHAIERACELDARHARAIADLVRLSLAAGAAGMAADRAQRYLAVSPHGDDAVLMRMLAAPSGGPVRTEDRPEAVARALRAIALDGAHPDRSLALFRRVEQSPGIRGVATLAALLAAHVAAGSNAPEEVDAALGRAAARDPEAALDHAAFLATLPEAVAAPDDLSALIARLERRLTGSEQALKVDSRDMSEALRGHATRYALGLARLRSGDSGEALRYADACEALAPPVWAASLPRWFAYGIRARHAIESGDSAQALDLLDALPLGPWIHLAGESPWCTVVGERFVRARALAALGREDEARSWAVGIAEVGAFEIALRGAAARIGG